MKNMKVSIIILLALVLLFVTACSSNTSNTSNNSNNNTPASGGTGSTGTDLESPDPFGKYDDTKVINIGYRVIPNNAWPEGSDDTIYDNRYTRLIEDRFNIKFEYDFEVPVTGYNEKINLLIASNDLPDFTFVTEAQFKILAESEVLEDLTQVFEDYASPFLKEVISSYGPNLTERVSHDGKLLGLPSTTPAHQPDGAVWIREDWLRNVGIELPKVISIDDLENVAKAFIEQDPNQSGQKDTYGIQSTSTFVSANTGYNTLDLVFAAYKSLPRIWINDENGNIVYGSITPETKQALGKLNEWYTKGLLDKEFGTIKPDQFSKDLSAGKAGISMSYIWATTHALADSIRNEPEAEWGAYILAADDGKYYARQPNPLDHIMVVKKGVANPEAIVKVLNLFAEIDNDVPGNPAQYMDSPGTLWSVRPIQMLFRANNIVRDRFQSLSDAAEGKKTMNDLSIRDQPLYENYLKGFEELKAVPADWAYILYMFEGGPTVLNSANHPVYSEFYGITPAMELKWANLIKLEDEAFIRMIVGDQPLDYFETFVSEWKRQGGDEITQEVEQEVRKHQ